METLNGLSDRSLQYYAIAKKWNSEIEFYKFETKFLKKMLDECFFLSTNAGERKQITSINNELMRLEVDKNQLENSLQRQISHLEMALDDVLPEDISLLMCTQIFLENQINCMFAEYRELKKSIFALLQNLMFQKSTPASQLFLN